MCNKTSSPNSILKVFVCREIDLDARGTSIQRLRIQNGEIWEVVEILQFSTSIFTSRYKKYCILAQQHTTMEGEIIMKTGGQIDGKFTILKLWPTSKKSKLQNLPVFRPNCTISILFTIFSQL